MEMFGIMLYFFFLIAVAVCMFDTKRRGTKKEFVVEVLILAGMIACGLWFC